MNYTVLLIIFLIVWVGIAAYLFYLDSKIRELKKILKFRENSKV
ncbi:MAG: hypothetical protein Kow0042_02650 [Calditrichia bacterium]